MGAHFYKEPSNKELQEAFKCFDKDNSGFYSENYSFQFYNINEYNFRLYN